LKNKKNCKRTIFFQNKKISGVTDIYVLFYLTSTVLNNTANLWVVVMVFSNTSAISWRPVLVVEEAGVPVENHRPWTSNW